MMKKKTFSCIIFENGLTILSFDAKKVGSTRENPSFSLSVLLTVVVLLDGVCGVVGGCCWWCWYLCF